MTIIYRILLTILCFAYLPYANSQCVVAPVPNNSCYQQVILDDDFCCYVTWDALCQSAYDGCSPSSSTPTTGDCPGAVPICTNNLSFAVDPNGFGSMDELCIGCTSNPGSNPASGHDGCLHSGELNSTWFSISVTGGGSLQFSFGTPGGFNCYDWIMWNYNPTACASISSNALAPVRCNWNAPCGSFTGVGAVPAGGDPGNFEPTLNVTTGQQFLICMSNYSSAYTTVPLQFTGTANIQCIPLNVELTSFSGSALEGYNVISWETTAEVNSSHFILEKSLNGTDFYEIATVEGAGTTLESTHYDVEDRNAIGGISYYRLKQVDFDGTAEMSSLIAINTKQPDDFGILSLFPNPASSSVALSIFNPGEGKVEITLSSSDGRARSKNVLSLEKGLHQIPVDISNYSRGCYLVSVFNKETGERDFMRLVIE